MEGEIYGLKGKFYRLLARLGICIDNFRWEIATGLCNEKVTKKKVVTGLKFIAEHPDMDQDQLIAGLIDLWCIFTFEDIKKQIPNEQSESYLAIGANIFPKYIYTRTWRSHTDNNWLSEDSDESIYGIIRKLTGDKTYTKKYVDSLVKKNSAKNEKNIENNGDIDKEDETREALQKIISLLIKRNERNDDCEIVWNWIILRSKNIKTPDDAYERIKTIAMLGTSYSKEISKYLREWVNDQDLKKIITWIKKLAKEDQNWADNNYLNWPNIQNVIYLNF